ncbi:MAG: hypothetical protein KDD94_10905, partial [Calditrichaeota bacterium]|nr:hypothetical protein [Calditrichota bacterium]
MNFTGLLKENRAIVLFLLLFVCLYSYTFDKKIDLNGDNTGYYMLAKSMADGQGYSNLNLRNKPPANSWPPGYPLVMLPVLKFMPVSSVVTALKIENGIFLISGLILFFLFMLRIGISKRLAITITLLNISNIYLLKFADVMMSEMSFLFFSLLLLYYLLDLYQSDQPFTDYRCYLAVIVLGFLYLIKTQSITLIVAVLLALAIKRKWKAAVLSTAGVVLCNLPWMIRNYMNDLGTSRYFDQLVKVNPWRPEAGTVTIFGVLERFLDNLIYFITKAIPDALFPFVHINYASDSAFHWLAGIIILVVFIYSFRCLPDFIGITLCFYFV